MPEGVASGSTLDSREPSGPLDHRIIIDAEWGYRRLAEIPSSPELDRFYESGYRDQIDPNGRAPGLARLVAGGPDAERERQWLEATLHADVRLALGGALVHGAPQRVLDIGAGTGALVASLVDDGWAVVGIEPAIEIGAVGRSAGLPVEACTATEYLARWEAEPEPFGGVCLMNVLEHVPDPIGLLRSAIRFLAPGGRLVIRVPNDFNPLQLAAQAALGLEPWWIAVPDHVNYFDHATIVAILERLGLDVVERSTDFPMEVFLLMGEDYTSSPEVGRRVHEQRRLLELRMDADTRRAIGRAHHAAGIGRNTFVVGQVR